MQVLYTASATSTGDGRTGHVRSIDGVIDTDLAVPKEMGGAGGALPNPEEFFRRGYARVSTSALRGIARREKIDLTDHRHHRRRRHRSQRKGGYGLTVAIEAEIPSVDTAKAKELIEAAHLVCPYSNATRGTIDVNLTVA